MPVAQLAQMNRLQRKFNVSLNGTPVLSDFDIVAEAGAALKAIVRDFTTRADTHGNITIDFMLGSENYPKVSGIEIVPATRLAQIIPAAQQ